MSRWLLKKHSFKAFKFHLLVLIVLETLVILSWCYYKPLKDKVAGGYIVKQGTYYIVLWSTDTKQQFMFETPDLRSAIQYAREDLGLELAHDRMNMFPLEANWLSSSVGGTTFYWKITNFNFFNRLTFRSLDEAQLFQRFVAGGAYSPSPIGHSLALYPIAKNSQ